MADEIKLDVLYKIANDLEMFEYYSEASSVDGLIKDAQFLGKMKDIFDSPIYMQSGFGDTGPQWQEAIEKWKDYFDNISVNINGLAAQNPGNIELAKVAKTINDAGLKFYGKYLGPKTVKGKEIDRASRRGRGALKWHEKVLHPTR